MTDWGKRGEKNNKFIDFDYQVHDALNYDEYDEEENQSYTSKNSIGFFTEQIEKEPTNNITFIEASDNNDSWDSEINEPVKTLEQELEDCIAKISQIKRDMHTPLNKR